MQAGLALQYSCTSSAELKKHELVERFFLAFLPNKGVVTHVFLGNKGVVTHVFLGNKGVVTHVFLGNKGVVIKKFTKQG